MGFINRRIADLLSGGWAAAAIKVIVLLVVLSFLFLVITNSFYWVARKQRAVEDFAGKYRRTSGPGLHLRFPLLSTVTKVSMKVQQLRVTVDSLSFGTLELVVRYYVTEGKERESVDNLDEPLEQMKRAATNAAIEILTGKTHQEAMGLRQTIVSAVTEAFGTFIVHGYRLNDVLAVEIRPNRQIQAELESVESDTMKATRDRAAARAAADLVTITANAEAERLGIQAAAQVAAVKAQKELVDELSTTWEIDVESVLAWLQSQQYLDTVRATAGKGATLVVYPPAMPELPPMTATPPAPPAAVDSTE